MATFLTANSYLGLGIEATRGTASSAIKYIPITAPQVTPMQTFFRDEALRGSAVTEYDHITGVRHDEYDVKGYVYAETFPLLVRAILGGTDTVTGSAAPYTHTIPLLNDQVGSQPPSVTIKDFDGANAFQMLGAQMSDLNITFGAEAAAEWSAKFVGNPYTNISAPAATFASTTFVPGWNVSISIGGTAIDYVEDGELKIDRKAAPIFAVGSQAPRTNFAGPVDVSGRLVCVVNSTSDIFSTTAGGNYGLTRAAQPLVITLTDPVSNYSTAFTMSSTQFVNPKRNRGKSYVEVEVAFEANANATDSGGTGYSPIKVVSTNGSNTPF